MRNQQRLLLPAIIAGAAFIILAIIYWVEPAKSLPLPDLLGHQSGSNTIHTKHGIASFLLGLGCFAYAWFQTGPKNRGTTQAG
jgi:hypothetical protein